MNQSVRTVTDHLQVTHHDARVHLHLSGHLDVEMTMYSSQSLVLPPDVARRLGEALIEVAAVALAGPVAS